MWLAPLFRKHQSAEPGQPSSKFAILALLAILSILSILPFIYLGVFSRYQADDYCFSRMLIEGGGYFGGLAQMYTRISDRFSTMLVIGLIEPLGKMGLQILPGLLIAIFFIASVTLLVKISIFFKWPLKGIELVSLAGVFTFICLYSAPDLFQSVLWMSGSVTYFLPLGLMLFALAGMIGSLNNYNGKQIPLSLAFALFLIFVFIGGFSETTAAMMLGMMLIFVVIVFWKTNTEPLRRAMITLLVSCISGLVVAMVLMILAPGNEYRLALMPEHPDLFKLIWLSFRYALGFSYQTITSYPLPTLISAVIAFVIATQRSWKEIPIKQSSWLLWVLPVSVFLVLIAICAPSAYAQSAYPENRALLSARVVVTAGLMMWSYLLGVCWRNWTENKAGFNEKQLYKITAFVMIIVSFYLVNGSLQTLSMIPESMKRADAWDHRAEDIANMKLQKQKDLVIRPLDSYGRIREISDDPKNWVNRCAAVHYGVDSIVAK